MININLFLQSLKNGNLKIRNYNYEKYECEFSSIAAMIHQRDIAGLIEFLSAKEGAYFEVKHPFYDIALRAVYNINLASSVNVVFFNDKTNQYPLAILQICNFINCFICENSCFIVSEAWQGAIKGSLGGLISEVRKNNIKNEDLKFREVEYGFILSHHRPAHYFHHILVNYIQLPQRLIAQEKSYFYPKYVKFAENLVYFTPFTYLNQNCDLLYERVYKESLEANSAFVVKDTEENTGYSLTLWLGIPGERRVWLQQWEGIPLILKNLSLYFPSIKVYVDGLTAYDGERIEVKENLEAFEKIAVGVYECFIEQEKGLQFLKQEDYAFQILSDTLDIKLKSLSGYDYRTKICYCAMCDIAISECSTTALVPFNFCKKPGVVFGLADSLGIHSEELARNIPFLYAIHKDFLISTHLGLAQWVASIPPEHLYNLTAKSLEELSKEGKFENFSKENPLKIHRLPVPPVELYAKLYELEKKTQVSLKGNKAEQEILGKIQFQRKLLKAQNLLLKLEKSESQIIPSTPQTSTLELKGAKERIQHHLAYKLGEALIICSKSLWGYITMPYVLSFIKAQHRFQQDKYQRAIAKNPTLKLPKLESYADYEQALKEKQCYTYKLGLALIEADKAWFKGGYLWFYLESKRLKREFQKERE